MDSKPVTRRKFMRDSAMVVASVAVGLDTASGETLDTSRILNYNPNMEYRRLGKTNLMVSAVGLGGHSTSNDKERYEVVSRCLDIGINYIDSTGSGELLRDIKALAGRRDRVYLGISETGQEPRNLDYRTAKKLITVLDESLGRAKLEYTDLWRITVYFTSRGADTLSTHLARWWRRSKRLKSKARPDSSASLRTTAGGSSL